MISRSWVNGTLVECEFSERAQRHLLLCSLYALRDTYLATGWQMKTPEEAAEALTESEDDSFFVFVGDKLVCLSAAQPWFSKEYVLTEEFVDPGVPPETVKAIMLEVCRLVDIDRFEVGTRAVANQRHAGLSRLYQQQGLAVSTVTLMGVVNGQ